MFLLHGRNIICLRKHCFPCGKTGKHCMAKHVRSKCFWQRVSSFCQGFTQSRSVKRPRQKQKHSCALVRLFSVSLLRAHSPSNLHICPEKHAEMQAIYNKHHKVSSHVKVHQNTYDSVRNEYENSQ